ncbi:hypothetical protein BKA66DRAFT_463857 [Pyrenochaeta sp. MPI-SDFR-AT-0127]|nr:hypothetical protein BKA66DRAFT_463857 [Pyrenochaeta sp. MPI-SDFR-AT-0127]
MLKMLPRCNLLALPRDILLTIFDFLPPCCRASFILSSRALLEAHLPVMPRGMHQPRDCARDVERKTHNQQLLTLTERAYPGAGRAVCLVIFEVV